MRGPRGAIKRGIHVGGSRWIFGYKTWLGGTCGPRELLYMYTIYVCVEPESRQWDQMRARNDLIRQFPN
jgi:hypothetical protein